MSFGLLRGCNLLYTRCLLLEPFTTVTRPFVCCNGVCERPGAARDVEETPISFLLFSGPRWKDRSRQILYSVCDDSSNWEEGWRGANGMLRTSAWTPTGLARLKISVTTCSRDSLSIYFTQTPIMATLSLFRSFINMLD